MAVVKAFGDGLMQQLITFTIPKSLTHIPFFCDRWEKQFFVKVIPSIKKGAVSILLVIYGEILCGIILCR